MNLISYDFYLTFARVTCKRNTGDVTASGEGQGGSESAGLELIRFKRNQKQQREGGITMEMHRGPEEAKRSFRGGGDIAT